MPFKNTTGITGSCLIGKSPILLKVYSRFNGLRNMYPFLEKVCLRPVASIAVNSFAELQ